MRNARQIRDIVLAVFGPQIFESSLDADTATESNTDYRELALGWQKLADSYSKGAGEGDNSELVISVAKVGLRYGICSSDINKCPVASACTGGPQQHGQQL
jgi:hypothetical protein